MSYTNFSFKKNRNSKTFLYIFTSTDGFDREICAKKVYGKCGSQFSQKLKTNPGYDVLKLCRVFAEERSCTTTEAENYNCKESRLLKRFKENSRKAAWVVLKEICPSPRGKLAGY